MWNVFETNRQASEMFLRPWQDMHVLRKIGTLASARETGYGSKGKADDGARVC